MTLQGKNWEMLLERNQDSGIPETNCTTKIKLPSECIYSLVNITPLVMAIELNGVQFGLISYM